MKKKFFKWLRLLFILIFVVSVGVIALYPFKGRDLTLSVETTEVNYEMQFTWKELHNTDKIIISHAFVEDEHLQNIRVFGTFQSICLATFTANDLEMGMEENQTPIFKESAKEKIIALSDSFLLERLCIVEGFLALFMFMFFISFAIEEKLDPDNRNNHGPVYEVKRFFSDIVKYAYYMVYAARTDLKAEVANSYLNRLWWLLEPFFTMLVYVIVFGKIMGRSIENYATFVYSALLMWTFFSKTVNYSVKLVRNNKDIVTKVYVPKFVILISNMFLNLFKLLFSLIVLVGMMFIFKIKLSVATFYVFPVYAVMILFSFGVGMIMLHYGVYVDDLSYAVEIALRMLMFLSGIFYELTTTLSEPLGTIMLCFNPMAFFIDTMRNALVYGRVVNIPLLGIWFMVSLILCCIGVHIVYRNENGYVKVV